MMYKVKLRTEGDKTYLDDLPIVRTGVWNGQTISEEKLRACVANHTTLKARGEWLPALWGDHSDKRADQAQGFMGDLRFDEAQQVLFGSNIEVTDPAVVTNLKARKYRWSSVEIHPYDIGEGQVLYPVVTGTAFVPRPGCVGLPFSLEAIRLAAGGEPTPEVEWEEFELESEPAAPSAAHQGGRQMTKIEQIKAFLAGKGWAASEDEVVALAAHSEPGGEVTPPPVELSADPRFAQYERDLADVKKALETERNTVLQLSAREAQKDDETFVDSLAVRGIVPPGMRQEALLLAAELRGKTVKRLVPAATEGGAPTEQEIPARELLPLMLSASSVHRSAALTFLGSESPENATQLSVTKDEAKVLAGG